MPSLLRLRPWAAADLSFNGMRCAIGALTIAGPKTSITAPVEGLAGLFAIAYSSPTYAFSLSRFPVGKP